MAVQLSDEVRLRLDRHLDAVEQALVAAGSSRERRRGVVDDLEAQIMDMLAAKGAVPTVADLEEVLGKLDPPGAYGEAGGAPMAAVVAGAAKGPAVKARFSRAASWGFACILASVLPVPLLVVLGYFYMSAAPVSRPPMETFTMPPQEVVATPISAGAPEGQAPQVAPIAPTAATEPAVMRDTETHRFNSLFGFLPCMAIVLGPLGILGTVLGGVGFGQIVRSKGAVRGLGVALFDGLFYPVILLLFVIMAVVGR